MNHSAGFAALRADCAALAVTPAKELARERGIWIFGAGQFGRDLCTALLAKGFQPLGFIETQPRTDQVLDLPVRSWQQLSDADRQAQLAIGIYNRGMPLDALDTLARSHGFNDVFMPWDAYGQFQAELGWRYWLSGRSLLLDQLDAIEESHDLFSDTASQSCLLNIVRFRLGLHNGYGDFRHDDPQYFNALTLDVDTQKTPIRYVDGGAYNGDTLLELAALRPISCAYLFEPDAENFAALKKNLRQQELPVQCLPLALSNGYQMLSFNAGNGEAGTISANGTVHIAAMALDDLLHGQSVDFIKLDVEGAEIAALQGAADVIKRCRPTLAISFYHRAQDLWEIPQALAALCPDYRFYLRQHFFNSFDSVLYAVPSSH